MKQDRTFFIALFVSSCLHIMVCLNYENIRQSPHHKIQPMVKITYLKTYPQLLEFEKLTHNNLPVVCSLQQRHLSSQQISSDFKDFLTKDKASIDIKVKEEIPLKPNISKPDIIAIKKKITLPPIDINKINNPSYVSYYQFVREKIRKAAYQNYTRTETGSIYLAFVIASDGTLKDVYLNEERSALNYYLRQISLRSIRDAAPFPPFPKELDYPQLSFNVIISFEVE
ncbi:MAG: TonB C-terminal domain-containing protein [Candidatus Omnitrophica bacterium]|nr:TonB C-terminal domain-containing protein [Candidatus Omnitrophota bacterium]